MVLQACNGLWSLQIYILFLNHIIKNCFFQILPDFSSICTRMAKEKMPNKQIGVLKNSLVEATYYFVELLYNQAFFCVSLQTEKIVHIK